MVCVAPPPPLKFTVLVPAEKALPALGQLPPIFIVAPPPFSVPLVKVRLPATPTVPLAFTAAPVLLILKLFSVKPLPPSKVASALPFKVVVPLLCVNVPPE